MLIAAQGKAQLTLALRPRPGDDAAINRVDDGMVDDAADAVLQDSESFVVPMIPGIGVAGTAKVRKNRRLS